MKEFLFDMKLFASIRVKAETEDEARAMIVEAMNCADANFGAWPNGDPITGECSLADAGGERAGEIEYLELAEDAE